MPGSDKLKNTSNKPKLPLHEWLAVVVIIAGMLLLTLLTTFNSSPKLPQLNPSPHYMTDPEIEVYVQGAVQHAGPLKIMQGTLIRDVLEIVKPNDEADLSKIKMQSKARHGQIIKIPKIETLTIYLEGAVKTPGSVVMPKGSKLQDLLESVQFAADANLKPLSKKRKLKDKEVIRVEYQ